MGSTPISFTNFQIDMDIKKEKLCLQAIAMVMGEDIETVIQLDAQDDIRVCVASQILRGKIEEARMEYQDGGFSDKKKLMDAISREIHESMTGDIKPNSLYPKTPEKGFQSNGKCL